MGSVIPDYTIVGSHSLVNKRIHIENSIGGCIIAGIPAKIVRSNMVRVFNSDIENKIWEFWRNNHTDYFPIENISIDEMAKYK